MLLRLFLFRENPPWLNFIIIPSKPVDALDDKRVARPAFCSGADRPDVQNTCPTVSHDRFDRDTKPRKARVCRYRFFERLWTRCKNHFFHDLAMNSAGEGIVPFMGMPLPAVQHNNKKEMYGEIAVFYEIAVHFPQFKLVVRGRLKPLSYSREVSHLQVRPHFAARPKLTTRSRSIGARP